MFKIGLLGFGRFGKVHAEAYRFLSNANVVAIADEDPNNLNLAKEQYGIQGYLTPEELLEKESPDILDICLPTYLHSKYLQMAISKKCHVFCEKPISLTVDESKKMIKTAYEAGIKFAVGHVLRFWPEYVYCKDLLQKGFLGNPISLSTHRLSGTSGTSWCKWIVNPKLSLGVFDMLIHDLDLARWFFGEPVNLNAHGVKISSNCWGDVNTFLEFDNNIHANLEASFLVPRNYPFTMYLRLVGEDGTLQFEFKGSNEIGKSHSAKQTFTHYRKDGKIKNIDLPLKYKTDVTTSAVASEIDYFLNCISENTEPKIISGENALKTFMLVNELMSDLDNKEYT